MRMSFLAWRITPYRAALGFPSSPYAAGQPVPSGSPARRTSLIMPACISFKRSSTPSSSSMASTASPLANDRLACFRSAISPCRVSDCIATAGFLRQGKCTVALFPGSPYTEMDIIFFMLPASSDCRDKIRRGFSEHIDQAAPLCFMLPEPICRMNAPPTHRAQARGRGTALREDPAPIRHAMPMWLNHSEDSSCWAHPTSATGT